MTPSGDLDAEARRGRFATWLLLLLALVPYVLVLGDPPLWDANEPLYAEPPREAVASGTLDDILAPPWNGKRWFVHPPLSSWLTMPFYAAMGPSPLAERIPMAIAAMAAILATFSIGRRLGGRRAGLAAAFVLSSTARYWLFARQLAGDVYLTACLTGAFALALPSLAASPEPGARRRLLGAHALVAVGTLAKGPVIVILYLVPLLLATRFSRPRVPLSALRPFALAAAVVLLGAPWFVYMGARFGSDFVREYFGWHHVRRIVSDDVGGRSVWFYFVAILGDAEPWILFVPLAALRAKRAWDRTASGLLPWLAAACPLVLFSLAVGKRNVYLLPMYPMIAVVLAPLVLDLWDGARARLARYAGALGAVAGAAATGLLIVGAWHVPPEIADGSRPYLVACALATIGLAAAAIKGSGKAVTAGIFASMLVLETISAFSLPTLGRHRPVPRLAASFLREAKADEVAVVYGTSIHSLLFYSRRATVYAKSHIEVEKAVPPGGRAFVLASEDALAHLAANAPSLVLTEVDRAPYFTFNFDRNILGKGKSSVDLVLVRAERAAAPLKGEGAKDPPR